MPKSSEKKTGTLYCLTYKAHKFAVWIQSDTLYVSTHVIQNINLCTHLVIWIIFCVLSICNLKIDMHNLTPLQFNNTSSEALDNLNIDILKIMIWDYTT